MNNKNHFKFKWCSRNTFFYKLLLVFVVMFSAVAIFIIYDLLIAFMVSFVG